MKLKRQFRLYDIYRYVALKTNEIPNVMGINDFYCNSEMSIIQVNGRTYVVEEGEEGLREIVRCINKQLGNCSKPGPRRNKKLRRLCNVNGLYGKMCEDVKFTEFKK